MDLISNLPKHILHDILSRMPEKDAARTSILSKSWKDTCSTSPVLVFVGPRYGIMNKTEEKMEDLIRKRNNFLNYVDSTLQRFHDQGLAIKQFKICLNFSDPHTLSPRIDYWMELSSESGVGVLHLTLFRPMLCQGEKYCLPPNILASKSLVKLILYGCFTVDKAFVNHPIKFRSLQVLSLSYVYVGEDQIIQNIISSCPMIENMTLKYCSGLKFVSIHSLPKLKVADFRGIQDVFVDAPSLEYFHYFSDDVNAACMNNMDKCRQLRGLCLSFPRNIIINNQWLLELFLKFPLLESLELEKCTISRKIQISSMQLKVLKFSSCFKLEEACIDAPKLYSCSYHGCEFTMPNAFLFNSSSRLEFNVKFEIGFQVDFLELRKFIENIKPKNFMVSIALDLCYPTDEFNPCVVQNLSVPPPCIKDLHLHLLSDEETLCLPLLIGLLWSCRPASISIKLNSTSCSRTIIKLLCDMLMERSNNCCCSNALLKCWWYELKDVRITSPSWKDENSVIDCKTLLDVLPTLSIKEEIKFRLES
ncbi:hypothetical protein RIF29_09116 [Crotalaria pallida]|uniref:F-box domain-containing protein n=1 Tax=Crotalaria pallida TaxID=3830 RepID=A0AAN9FZ95_CROPI